MKTDSIEGSEESPSLGRQALYWWTPVLIGSLLTALVCIGFSQQQPAVRLQLHDLRVSQYTPTSIEYTAKLENSGEAVDLNQVDVAIQGWLVPQMSNTNLKNNIPVGGGFIWATRGWPHGKTIPARSTTTVRFGRYEVPNTHGYAILSADFKVGPTGESSNQMVVAEGVVLAFGDPISLEQSTKVSNWLAKPD